MQPGALLTCGHCGRSQQVSTRGHGLQLCEMCSNPLEATPAEPATGAQGAPGDLMGWAPPPPPTVPPPSYGAAPAAGPSAAYEDSLSKRAARHRAESQRGLNFLALGLPLAFVMGLTPFLQYIGWFLKSLVHEIGHTFVAIVCGHVAIPKIALSGHAMTSIGDSHWTIRLAVVLSCVAAGRALLERRGQIIAFAALAVLYPLTFLEPVRLSVFLMGGLLFEAIAGGVCLWRCLYGEECHHDGERAAYGMLGWLFSGRVVLLGFGLAFQESVRDMYHSNGSFGLTNDLVRLSSEVLGMSLASCGFLLGVVALVIPGVVVGRYLLQLRAA